MFQNYQRTCCCYLVVYYIGFYIGFGKSSIVFVCRSDFYACRWIPPSESTLTLPLLILTSRRTYSCHSHLLPCPFASASSLPPSPPLTYPPFLQPLFCVLLSILGLVPFPICKCCSERWQSDSCCPTQRCKGRSSSLVLVVLELIERLFKCRRCGGEW